MNKLNDLGEIVDIITPVRLSTYGTNYADMLNGYIYNLKLSESFYPALSLLEVTFRNRICFAIEKLIYSDWLLKELDCRNILEIKQNSQPACPAQRGPTRCSLSSTPLKTLAHDFVFIARVSRTRK